MPKPKYHAGQVRTTETLSFSAPFGFVEMLDRDAELAGRSRSGHIVWLLCREIGKRQAASPKKKLKSPPLPVDSKE
jgi:hypothetical protein